ncbi:hypothetical protein RJ640_019413 [Escallonia rubra]|uniref:Neprosin PEP catalytic domain-containing protein n=1 Tax=Escallonia rubra TaxID=112253 RepID=A0AA88U6N2_9ASTE|nr:hypothetical protein RJ640_019413 [Escallonia rubra]
MALMGGFARIGNNEITVLVNDAEKSSDIDAQEAQQTLEIAEANLRKAEGKRQTIEANLALRRARTRELGMGSKTGERLFFPVKGFIPPSFGALFGPYFALAPGPESPEKAKLMAIDGSTYNCVDVHQQHALGKPILAGHNIEEGCPLGKIPIRQMASQDTHSIPSPGGGPSQLDFAGIIAEKSPERKYHGAAARISLYNPSVGPHQASSATIFIESGEGSDLNQIQVGWTDTVNGNWWFFGPTGDAVGFWPRALFTSLGQGADSVRLGGQVLTPESDNVRPPMGSGLFNNGNYYTTCYMSDVQVNTNSYSPPDDSWIQGVDSRCYFEGDHSHKGGTLRYSFVFGGSGGKDHATCLW